MFEVHLVVFITFGMSHIVVPLIDVSTTNQVVAMIVYGFKETKDGDEYFDDIEVML